MAGEDHHLELGSNSFIAGFEEQLIGAAVGEARTVNITFPEGYGNEKLSGQPAVFECTVKEIREPVPAELNDELAQSMGRSEEHTSELQSLMRISYAVFCLKTKKQRQKKHNITKNNIKQEKQ